VPHRAPIPVRVARTACEPPASMPPTVTITARGEARLDAGHPWIYRSDVSAIAASAGDVVRVIGARGRFVGRALYSERSQISLRVFSRHDGPLDASFIAERVASAVAFRQSLRITGTAYRLVHGEADLLPSLVVDRYGDYLVVQTLSQGMDRLLPEVVAALNALVSPRGVLARNDPRVRELEGLDRKVELVSGDVPERVTVDEDGVQYEVDPWHGQKTGMFLDQRENHTAAATYARGRLLDAFSYQGGFALRLARRCTSALAVDISEAAVALIRENAARNGLANVETLAANVFDTLRDFERDHERFDTIVLDPPAFAKNRASVPRALAGYKEINLRALRVLNPGGCLVTCSCSYNVDEATFGQVIHDAARDARVDVVVVEKRMQSRDHPVLLGVPETYYLKCFILRKL
jgi:23S rRNA (cytosine1962-C5)-methyltransferase